MFRSKNGSNNKEKEATASASPAEPAVPKQASTSVPVTVPKDPEPAEHAEPAVPKQAPASPQPIQVPKNAVHMMTSSQTSQRQTIERMNRPAEADASAPEQTEVIRLAPMTPERLFAHTKKMADTGRIESIIAVAAMYEEGNGTDASMQMAAKYYLNAASKGVISAQVRIGKMYEDGEGIAQSSVNAERWYTRAADQGSSEAQFYLGCMYEDGELVEQSDKTALKWYSMAAAQGDRDAQLAVERLTAHEEPEDGPEDDVEEFDYKDDEEPVAAPDVEEPLPGIPELEDYIMRSKAGESRYYDLDTVRASLADNYDIMTDDPKGQFSVITGIPEDSIGDLRWEPMPWETLVDYILWRAEAREGRYGSFDPLFVRTYAEELAGDLSDLQEAERRLRELCAAYPGEETAVTLERFIPYMVAANDGRVVSDDSEFLERALAGSLTQEDLAGATGSEVPFIDVDLYNMCTSTLIMDHHTELSPIADRVAGIVDYGLNYFGPAPDRDASADEEVVRMAIRDFRSLNETGVAGCGRSDMDDLEAICGAVFTAQKILFLSSNSDPERQFDIAKRLDEQGQGRVAIGWYAMSAEQGYDRAQYELGLRHESGKDVPQDYATAFMWYRRSADDGNAVATYKVARMTEDGIGTRKDRQEAMLWYVRASAMGVTEARDKLAETKEQELQKDEEPDYECRREEYVRAEPEGREVNAFVFDPSSQEASDEKPEPVAPVVAEAVPDYGEVSFDDNEIMMKVNDMQIIANVCADDDDCFDDIDQSAEPAEEFSEEEQLPALLSRLSEIQVRYLKACARNEDTRDILTEARCTCLMMEHAINSVSLDIMDIPIVRGGLIDEDYESSIRFLDG